MTTREYDLAESAVEYWTGPRNPDNPFAIGLWKLRYTDDRQKGGLAESFACEAVFDAAPSIPYFTSEEREEFLSDLQRTLEGILS